MKKLTGAQMRPEPVLLKPDKRPGEDDIYYPLADWGERYPADFLVNREHEYPMPPPEVLIESGDVKSWPVVCFVGERASGLRQNTRWWTRTLNLAKRPWLLVPANEPSPQSCLAGNLGGDEGEKRTVQLVTDFVRLGMSSGDASARIDEGIATLTSERDTPIHLILRGMYGLGDSTEPPPLTFAFRRYFETALMRPGGPLLRLMFTADALDPFLDNAHVSGLIPLSRAFKVPSLGVREVCLIARAISRADLPQDHAEQILEHTGGQPYLVQVLLQALKDPIAKGWLRQSDVFRASRACMASPHHTVKMWKRDLRGILKADSSLHQALASYVRGHEKAPEDVIALSDRRLFVAGWIGRLRGDWWGIRSKLHAHWAREVLSELGGAP